MMTATYTLQASALDFCAGSEGVQFALSGTEAERNYQLFRDNSAVGAVLSGTGNAATFTGLFNEAGAYIARTIADELYCATAMDGTRAVVENPLPANPDVISEPRQCAGTVTLSASSPGAVIDWYADAATTATLHTGASYTTPEIETSTTYYVQARMEYTGCLSARVPVLATVIAEGCCTAPGSTVNFTAFDPCSNAATDDYWYLTDTREANNIQTYKVKKMADGKIWMVQDLKFGDKCNKTTFTGSTTKDLTGNITSLTDKTYYGDCTAATNTSTPSNRGYLYDWAAAVNKSGAYSGGSTAGCSGTTTGSSGTAPGACQGICPVGWHIPTANSAGEFKRLHDAIGGCLTSNDKCWNSSSAWEGVYGGERKYDNGALTNQGVYATYWSSTWYMTHSAYALLIKLDASDPVGNANYWQKQYGRSVRCLKNY
jgi:uncharacterized protein (TIGR02145 family)